MTYAMGSYHKPQDLQAIFEKLDLLMIKYKCLAECDDMKYLAIWQMKWLGY